MKLFSTSEDLLSPQEILELARIYLDNAHKLKGSKSALVLCHDAKDKLSQMKKAIKKEHDSGGAQEAIRNEVATLYFELGKIFADVGQFTKANESYKKVAEWGGRVESGKLILSTGGQKNTFSQAKEAIEPQLVSLSTLSPSPPSTDQKSIVDTSPTLIQVFTMNELPLAVECKLPKAAEKIDDTIQLTYCLSLLQVTPPIDDELDQAARTWLRRVRADTYEQNRLKVLAADVVYALGHDEVKNPNLVKEAVYLTPVLEKDTYKNILSRLVDGLEKSILLDLDILDGLAWVIESAGPSYLEPDDLVRILERLNTRLHETHSQSPEYICRLTQAVSRVLDAMADSHVKGLKREQLHEPLSAFLNGLRLQESTDPYLVYQAAYAFQALQYVPDDEIPWQSLLRRGKKILSGVSGLVSAAKGFDVERFVTGLGQIQDGVAGIAAAFSVAKDIYENVAAMAESGQTFIDALKEGIRLNQKKKWYTALRGVDTLLQNGQLVEFQKLVYEAPCRLDPAFQWGLCERLGKIAADSKWSVPARQHAITFLGEIYTNDAMWGQDVNIKQWILDILKHLANPSENDAEAINYSEALLKELARNGDALKQELYRKSQEKGLSQHPLRIASLSIAKGSPSLLDRVQLRSAFEGDIHRLKQRRLESRNIDIYIPPQAKASINANDDTAFPLMERATEFLRSNQKVFLLLGESGAGKSTFTQALETSLWDSYKKEHNRIPLYIHLPTIYKPEYDLIGKQLLQEQFSPAQINEMKSQCEFILICDGYDECLSSQNLYKSNRLDQWNAQMVISCRTEYLGNGYLSRFQPIDRNQSSSSVLLQEAVVTPFSAAQIQEYIKQFISKKESRWALENYRKAFEDIPNLLDLVKNPFLLTLSLQTLPNMVDLQVDLSTVRITRVRLYDEFLRSWLERGKIRLEEKVLTDEEKREFNELDNEGFERNATYFLMDLAVAILEKHSGNHVVEYSTRNDKRTWKEEFFGQDKQLLRDACPLSRIGNRYQVIHRSIYEYAIARAIFDPQESGATNGPVAVQKDRTDQDLRLNSQNILKEVSADIGQPLLNSPLGRNNIVHEHAIMQFLAERAEQEPLFKEQLFSVISRSKSDSSVAKAAANAITVLIKARVQFNGADLQGIRIPGADLSYGVFDRAQLQGADLTMVNLSNVWLRQADLSGSQMTGVQFGELPFLKENSKVGSCKYSLDGKTFSVVLNNGQVNVYAPATWEKVKTFDSAVEVYCSSISPKGDLVAIGSIKDISKQVQLWDIETGKCRRILSENAAVRSIAFSPTGNRIASGSLDNTVRIWDIEAGVCLQVLSGHSSWAQSLAFSPNEAHFASGGADKTLRLWNIETGVCTNILSGHHAWVQTLAYSPKGDRIASGSHDETVRLWDVNTGACLHILSGHSGTTVGAAVTGVTYSPDGRHVTSCSFDLTVRIWDVETGECLEILSGHTDLVMCVAFSPNGRQIASAGMDMTVRLWDIETKATRYYINGHEKDVQCIAFAPNDDQIVSGSGDNTVRLWDVETGVSHRIIDGCHGGVKSIAYSPNGDKVAIGSGALGEEVGMLQLWEVETGVRRQIESGLRDYVSNVAFSPAGDGIAVINDDKAVRLYDVGTGKCRHVFRGTSNSIQGLSFSPKGGQIASAGRGTIQIWDVETGECQQSEVGITGTSLWLIQYSPSGNLIAFANTNNTIWLWDLETGSRLHILSDHTDDIKCIVFSKTGSLLASASDDLTIRLWDVASGQCRATIEVSQGIVNSIAWKETPENIYLATACQDRSVRLWRLIEKEGQYSTHLCWSSSHDELNVTSTTIQDIQGLSILNEQLLKQRGAIVQ
ncbi:hypothetical protein BGZ49_010385 [Haplosporangium sp. Z 27]|nr:hypothetical protein BGZ49_010385 [Haplosporangium sp. Z 27]